VQELTPDIASRLGVAVKNGVVVVDVEPGTPADDAGIVVGDIILEINKQPVKNVSDYEKATKALKTDTLIKLYRGYVLIKKANSN
jgi:S1-C subfamily serine protease